MSIDAFAKHGIDHISPSSLRLFKENLAVWVGRYLLKVNDEAGPKAWRGSAVEGGLDQVLFHNADLDTAMLYAKRAWDKRAMGIASDDALKEYEQLPLFMQQAMEAFKDQPIPLTRQSPIKIDLPGISVPLTGYTDYKWHDRGVDLKTTHRIPSQPDPAHVEQMAAYMLSTGLPFSLVYCSTRRWVTYEVTPPMAADGYDRLIEAAAAMQSFLAKVDGAHDALSMIAPDYQDFYFSDPMRDAIRAAKRPMVVLP